MIAAVNGPRWGWDSLFRCIAISFCLGTARFGTAFAKRGLIAEYGLAWMLPRLIGPAKRWICCFRRGWWMRRGAPDGLSESGVPAGTFCTVFSAYAQELANMSARDRWGSSKPKFITRCFKH